jgi:hypothetical protein
VLFDNLGLLSLPPQLSSTIDCAPVGNFACPTPFLGGGGILPGPGGIATFPTIADQRAATSAFVPVGPEIPEVNRLDAGYPASVLVRLHGGSALRGNPRHSPACADSDQQAVGGDADLFLPTYTTAPSQATLDASTLDLSAMESASPIVPAFDAAGFNGGNYNGV